MTDNPRYVRLVIRWVGMTLTGAAFLYGWWRLMETHSVYILFAMLSPFVLWLCFSGGWALWNLSSLAWEDIRDRAR